MSQDDEEISVTRKHRRTTSCLGVAVFSAFIILALVIGAYVVAQQVIQKRALAKFSLAEQAEFRKWLNTPIFLPEELRKKRPPLNPAIIGGKADFLRAALAVDSSFPRLRHTSDSLSQRLLRGSPLSHEEYETATLFTKKFAPVVTQGKALVSRPGYVLNDRRIPGPRVRLVGLQATSLLFTSYILLKAHAQQWDAALEALHVLMAIQRRDVESGVITHLMCVTLAGRINRVTRVLNDMTTDLVVLQKLLTLLTHSRSDVFIKQPDLTVLGGMLGVYQQMADDGFIKSGTPTPEQLYYSGRSAYANYLEWLINTLPAGSPRIAWAEEERERTTFYYGESKIGEVLETMHVGPAKPLARNLLELHNFYELPLTWEMSNERTNVIKTNEADFDLARLALARKIAQLENGPIPLTAEDFVPRYLPKFPTDPFTSAPLRFSAVHKSFYSAGPDATDNTGDDIYWLD